MSAETEATEDCATKSASYSTGVIPGRFSSLPIELIETIFSYLNDLKDILNVRSVCRDWADASEGNSYWKTLYLNTWGTADLEGVSASGVLPSCSEGIDWKHLYENNLKSEHRAYLRYCGRLYSLVRKVKQLELEFVDSNKLVNYSVSRSCIVPYEQSICIYCLLPAPAGQNIRSVVLETYFEDMSEPVEMLNVDTITLHDNDRETMLQSHATGVYIWKYDDKDCAFEPPNGLESHLVGIEAEQVHVVGKSSLVGLVVYLNGWQLITAHAAGRMDSVCEEGTRSTMDSSRMLVKSMSHEQIHGLLQESKLSLYLNFTSIAGSPEGRMAVDLPPISHQVNLQPFDQATTRLTTGSFLGPENCSTLASLPLYPNLAEFVLLGGSVMNRVVWLADCGLDVWRSASDNSLTINFLFPGESLGETSIHLDAPAVDTSSEAYSDVHDDGGDDSFVRDMIRRLSESPCVSLNIAFQGGIRQ